MKNNIKVLEKYCAIFCMSNVIIVYQNKKIVLHIFNSDDNMFFVAKETTLWGSCFSNVLGVIRMCKDIFCGDKGCLFSAPK